MEIPISVNTGSEALSNGSQEKLVRKLSASNGAEDASIKSDSFVVDMERFVHVTDKDMSPNSRITLQRTLSRKGSQRVGEKKINLTAASERDVNLVVTSPRAALLGASTPEKPVVVTVGAIDHSASPQAHNQVAVMANGTGTPESRYGGRRFSFRRSSPSGIIDPRRILFFFATLSSMGTILLIYFTLSMSKLSADENVRLQI